MCETNGSKTRPPLRPNHLPASESSPRCDQKSKKKRTQKEAAKGRKQKTIERKKKVPELAKTACGKGAEEK